MKQEKTNKVENKSIQISEWIKVGIMSIKRNSLPEEHPESFYNQLKSKGVFPEDYGYFLFIRDENGNVINIKGDLNKVKEILNQRGQTVN